MCRIRKIYGTYIYINIYIIHYINTCLQRGYSAGGVEGDECDTGKKERKKTFAVTQGEFAS